MSEQIPPAARPGGEGTPRCGVCGWTLAASRDEGCVEGDCSMRPVPKVRFDARPAAVSAPAGEATRTQFDYLLNAFEQASQHDQPATQGYGEKRRALFAYVRALESRSSSPASGAPDEDRLSRLLDLLEDSDVHQRAIALDPADALILRRYVSSQAARLAASERAGEANKREHVELLRRIVREVDAYGRLTLLLRTEIGQTLAAIDRESAASLPPSAGTINSSRTDSSLIDAPPSAETREPEAMRKLRVIAAAMHGQAWHGGALYMEDGEMSCACGIDWLRWTPQQIEAAIVRECSRRASAPPAGSGATELVDVEGIEAVIATLEGGPTAADAKKPLALRITQAISMLRRLAAHPAGTTREEG